MQTLKKILLKTAAVFTVLNLMAGLAVAQATGVELTAPVITKPTWKQIFTNLPRKVQIEWTGVFGATSYGVEVTCYEAPTCVVGTQGKPYTTSTEKTSLELEVISDDAYYFKVQAKSASGGIGPWSETSTFKFDTSAAPAKLPGIKATGKFENGYAKIDWDPVAGLGTTFDKYNIRWKKGSFEWIGTDATGKSLSLIGVANAYVGWDYYNLGNLSSGTWSFMVMPVKTVNGKYQEVGEYGNTVTIEIPGETPTLLSAPDVKMTVEGTMFKLSWEPLAGIGKDFDKYNVINKKGDLTTLDGVTGGGYIDWNYYNLDVKEKGVTWTFQVVAVKNVNEQWKEVGKRSAFLKATTAKDEPVQLTAPTITKPGENEVLTNFPREATFEWTAVNGASYYEFEITCDICVSSATKWLNPKTYSVNGTTFIKVVPGGDNEFRVRVKAIGTGNNVSPWSEYRYFRYKTAPAVPQEPVYKGNNGKTYTESDFKSEKTNIWTVTNANYAKFCWDKPEKYFEGYALYTTEGLFEKSLTEYGIQYLDKGLDCYTYPKYFGGQGTVSVRLYPYIILENGARKFIQPGYQKTATVQGNPKQVDPEKKFGPVNLTGQYVSTEDMLKLDWEPLEGLGTKFDKYNIIWKKGYHNGNSIDKGDAANSYISYGDYYNLLNLENGWWSFQVVPVKNENGTYTEVGERSGVVRVFVQKNVGAVEIPVEKNSISLAIVSWQNGLPKIVWSAYTEKAFDGYAMFVREGKWNKDQVTGVDAAYWPKTQTSHQMEKMKEFTGYTVRIVPYFINANGFKEFLYPASNTLYFETGGNEGPISRQTKYCETEEFKQWVKSNGLTMPGWSGSDGSYDVCLGGILEHETSWVTLKVLKLSNKLVKLAIEGADKSKLVLKKGKTKKILTDSDMLMSLTYDGVSPTTGGAMIRIETLELN